MPDIDVSDDLSRIFREESGRVVATLIRFCGDIDTAEDAAAEAFAVAAGRWPTEGVPENPGGWLTTTAKRLALDRLRRESSRGDRETRAVREASAIEDEAVHQGGGSMIEDDRLRLIFTCCHPALRPDTQVALTLQLLGGLTAAEVARAFLVPEATMNQRLVRAKRKIKANRIPYRIPTDAELPDRLRPVVDTVYLIFNEGHTATSGDELVRADLCAEAIRLARLLCQLMPDEAEAAGLLALLLLTHARRATRTRGGELVRLADQDRELWDGVAIDEGQAIVRRLLARNTPGPMQIQAAIAAVHTDATAARDTDWRQIVALYDHLLALRPDPVVALNRAIARAEVFGSEAALEDLELLAEPLRSYHLLHATRAELLRRLGREAEATEAAQTAAALTSNETERRHLIGHHR